MMVSARCPAIAEEGVTQRKFECYIHTFFAYTIHHQLSKIWVTVYYVFNHGKAGSAGTAVVAIVCS